jgi:hypothetical protein
MIWLGLDLLLLPLLWLLLFDAKLIGLCWPVPLPVDTLGAFEEVDPLHANPNPNPYHIRASIGETGQVFEDQFGGEPRHQDRRYRVKWFILFYSIRLQANSKCCQDARTSTGTVALMIRFIHPSIALSYRYRQCAPLPQYNII